MITLKTLAEATAQQVFDQVARHMLTQKERSQNEDGRCLYRGPNGLKCAAGCLIADDEYQSGWEDKTWDCLGDNAAVPPQHRYLISELQQIHDDTDVTYWKDALQRLAVREGLSAAVSDAFAG